ncbi:hypothetical protein N431DRAFT_429379 [Stipitochalara longipes BDJ]|nr:hypothetical protein N431DRAFT_429379 [Stipitochalara longipes BDJ]
MLCEIHSDFRQNVSPPVGMSNNYNSSASLPTYGIGAINCTTYPPLQANPDISGIGVLIGFLATSYITLLCCVAKYILECRQKKATNSARSISRWSFALENLIISLSDQQLVTGISTVIGGFSQLEWGLPVYHFQMVGNLAWFSTMTHILTLTVLREKMRLKSSLAIKTVRVVLMGCLVVLLVCVMAPIGYLTSAYGYYGMLTRNGDDFQGHGPIPAEFPAWCLYHQSIEWEDEDGGLMFHTGTYGYNILYMVISLGIIIYGYISRLLLLFPSIASGSVLRTPPGQPWIWIESQLAELQAFCNAGQAILTRTEALVKRMARLGHFLLYSFYILIVSGKHVFGSRTWELTWLFMALNWGSLRIIFLHEYLHEKDFFPGGNVYADGQTLSQQNVWGFGQVVSVVLLLLPLLSFSEAYLSFTQDESTASLSTGSITSNNVNPPTSRSHKTELQVEILGKPWHPSLFVLWILLTFMVGVYSLLVLSFRGGTALVTVNQLTDALGDDDTTARLGGVFRSFAVIIAVNLALLWSFILIMLPEWSCLSHRTGRVALGTFCIVASGIHIWYGVYVSNIYTGVKETGLGF